MGTCDFGDLMSAVVRCLGSERIARIAMHCYGQTWVNTHLTCTEVCQAGLSGTRQSESREAVQLRENDLPPKAASEGNK